MRKFILGVLLSGTSFAALAADLPARPSTRSVLAPAAVYNWSGFYAGVNAGYGWGNADTEFTLDGSRIGSDSVSPKGFIGGGQLGVNWQNGAGVFGLEADFQGSAQKDTSSVTVNVGIPVTVDYEAKVNYFGTVRGRAGYASGSWLWYVTGGWAYAKVTVEDSASNVSASKTRNGWTVGAGVEAALAGNWTWKAEYLYLDFGSIKDSTSTLAGTFASSTDVNAHVARLGLNYRF